MEKQEREKLAHLLKLVEDDIKHDRPVMAYSTVRDLRELMESDREL